jgi:hypothetical protein
MTLAQLIDQLQRIADENDADDIEVRLAFQPNWPLQFHVGSVEIVDTAAPDEDEEEYLNSEDFDTPEEYYAAVNALPVPEPTEEELVVYIAEGGSCYDNPYLPGAAKSALGWGRGR